MTVFELQSILSDLDPTLTIYTHDDEMGDLRVKDVAVWHPNGNPDLHKGVILN